MFLPDDQHGGFTDWSGRPFVPPHTRYLRVVIPTNQRAPPSVRVCRLSIEHHHNELHSQEQFTVSYREEHTALNKQERSHNDSREEPFDFGRHRRLCDTLEQLELALATHNTEGALAARQRRCVVCDRRHLMAGIHTMVSNPRPRIIVTCMADVFEHLLPHTEQVKGYVSHRED
jgi:hypothetical protein